MFRKPYCIDLNIWFEHRYVVLVLWGSWKVLIQKTKAGLIQLCTPLKNLYSLAFENLFKRTDQRIIYFTSWSKALKFWLNRAGYMVKASKLLKIESSQHYLGLTINLILTENDFNKVLGVTGLMEKARNK